MGNSKNEVLLKTKMDFELFKFLEISYVLLDVCMTFCYCQTLRSLPY